MSEVTAKDVKSLRDATGAGMMDAKRALVAADGDRDKAARILREKGLTATSGWSSTPRPPRNWARAPSPWRPKATPPRWCS